MLERYKRVVPVPQNPTYLDSYIDKEVICNQPIAGAVWNILSNLVLPVLMASALNKQASVQTWKTFQVQPYTIPANTIAGGEGNVSFENFPRTGARLARMAAWDVKATNQQQQNEVVQELVNANTRGNGGMFASLASLAADVFVPGSGALVGTVANSLGL